VVYYFLYYLSTTAFFTFSKQKELNQDPGPSDLKACVAINW